MILGSSDGKVQAWRRGALAVVAVSALAALSACAVDQPTAAPPPSAEQLPAATSGLAWVESGQHTLALNEGYQDVIWHLAVPGTITWDAADQCWLLERDSGEIAALVWPVGTTVGVNGEVLTPRGTTFRHAQSSDPEGGALIGGTVVPLNDGDFLREKCGSDVTSALVTG